MTGQRETRCERTDLPASMCSHCRGLGWEPVFDLPEPADPIDVGLRTGWKAEFPSTCPGCRQHIEAGDMIYRHADINRYVCASCADVGEGT